jgi:phage/plasmid-like protein (TIGR03299 family)
MAHEILVGTHGDARFLDTRGPAWHRLGKVVTREMTAREGLAEINAPTIHVVDAPPLFVPGIGDVDVATRYIVREALDDLPAEVLGRVSPDYYLVTPDEFCTVLDGAVGKPIETIGLLKNGKILFVTFKLPAFDVAGDEHENYLAVYNGMSGSDALKALNTPVRVVCMNTYKMADKLASEQYVIPHTESAMRELGTWIVDLYARALARGAAVKEALELLATYRPTEDEAKRVVAAAYPLPKKPSDFGPKLIVEQREKRFERRINFATGARESALELWNGAATGADTRAAAGTLFGLYNAVVEFEDYRQHGNADSEDIAEAIMVGRRGAIKERAFAASMSVAEAHVK